MLKLRLFFHPHFVIKYYLYKDLKAITSNYSFKGRILDIGCGNKPYQDLFKPAIYKGIDFKKFSSNSEFSINKPDYYFRAPYLSTFKLPFVSTYFDSVVSFQVLEHHPEVVTFIREAVRVTKKHGLIIISFPFIWGLHEEPNDYQRLTHYSIIRQFKKNKCKMIKIKTQGSIASTNMMLLMDYLIELSHKGKIHYIIALLLYPFFLVASYFSLAVDTICKSNKVFLNYIVVAQKLE